MRGNGQVNRFALDGSPTPTEVSDSSPPCPNAGAPDPLQGPSSLDGPLRPLDGALCQVGGASGRSMGGVSALDCWTRGGALSGGRLSR